MTLTLDVSPTCPGKRECARECHCSDRTTAIHRLTDLYLDPLLGTSNDVRRLSLIKHYYIPVPINSDPRIAPNDRSKHLLSMVIPESFSD